LLRALGWALERLGGQRMTSEGIGVKPTGLRTFREETAHVDGLTVAVQRLSAVAPSPAEQIVAAGDNLSFFISVRKL